MGRCLGGGRLDRRRDPRSRAERDHEQPHEGVATTIWSDSKLVVQTMNEWARGWKQRGWKRRRGPVENLDLVKPIYEYLQARPELELRWIKAHVGHRWNEYADGLATRWMA